MESLLKVTTDSFQNKKDFVKKTNKEQLEAIILDLNKEEGTLDKNIYDCPKCHNKGYIWTLSKYLGKYMEISKECDCLSKRKTMKKIKESGLSDLYNKCSFSTFLKSNDWQKHIYNFAIDFINNITNNKTFFIGGAVGSGKTHICSAITRKLIEMDYDARYFKWVDMIHELQLKYYSNDFNQMFNEYKNIKVLYIDDFLKPSKSFSGKKINPSIFEMKIAYELINYRYIQKDLITIISSELSTKEICKLDEAIGSRIIEMANQYIINLKNDKNKNQRIKW